MTSSAIIVMGPSKFYTVAKHLLKTAGSYVPVGAFTNVHFLNKLPADLRTAVMEESRKPTDRTVKVAIDITRHWEKQWVKEGGHVYEMSSADRKEYFRRTASLGDKILAANPKISRCTISSRRPRLKPAKLPMKR